MGEAVSKLPSLDEDIAIKEVSKWLDHKKIRPKRREDNEDYVEQLVEGFKDCRLTLDEKTHEISMKLEMEIGEIKKLIFQPRMTFGTVHPYLKKVKPGDADGRLLAYVIALTDSSRNVVDKLDTEDHKLALAIAVFFL